MKRLRIGAIYLVTNEEGINYLGVDLNWYIKPNNEEKEKFKSGLLTIQDALFDSVTRNKYKENKKGEIKLYGTIGNRYYIFSN